MRTPLLAVVLVLVVGLVHVTPHALAQDEDTLRTISGVVVGDDGTPLAGARVSGWVDGETDHGRDHDTTDAEGRFSLRLPDGRGAIDAYHEPWRRSASLEIAVDGDADDLRLVIAAPPPKTAVVTGVVRDAQGAPIEGATVSIGQGCCYAYAEDAERPEPATIEPAPPEDGNASGASTAAAPAKGDAAASPAIWYDGDWQETTTDAEGRYRFETYGGPREVTAHAKGFAQSRVTVDAVANETVTADLALEKVPAADAVLTGRVTDAQTGLPLANAQVSIENVAWSRYEWVQTDADGSFRVTTLPGWTLVRVHHWGGGDVTVSHGEAVASDAVASDGAEPAATRIAPVPDDQYYAFAKALRLGSGDNALDVALEPKPEPAIALLGYVLDPDAQAGVPDARVSVWNQDTGDWGQAVTDATGSFRILVRPGWHTVDAWAEGHLPGVATVLVLPDATTKRVDVEAPEGERRYAPCDDCRGGGAEPMPLVAEDGGEKATAEDAASFGDGDDARTTRTVSAQDGGTRATYAGGGGGLPPYEASSASAEGGDPDAGVSPVPAAPVAALLALLALAAIALRRRG